MPTTTLIKKVLVVDDESVDREAVCRALMAAGYEVAAAGGAEEALWLLGSTPIAPQAIVSNVHLPEMDGKALIRKIRTHRPGMKAVLLTAYGQAGEFSDLARSPETEFLTKPIHESRLLAVLDRFIGHPEEMPSEYWV